jgi:hypothetical protein
MTEEKLYELVKRLLTKTQSGAQNWEAGSEPDAFLTSFPKYSVKISRYSDNDGSTIFYGIHIYDENGTLMESMLDGRLAEKVRDPRVGRTMRELHEAARRKTMNVDTALDDILSSLE